MPHIDELFGATTLGAAGMMVAIMLQPTLGDAPGATPLTAAPVGIEAKARDTTPRSALVAGVRPAGAIARTALPAASAASDIPVVRLPTIDVVARRSVELVRIEREDELARRQHSVRKTANAPA